jgi:putative Ca2+/H+ antiporter (TMEM165/GDT1 family)
MGLDALLQSFGLVLSSEMGDKTQLLALVLALRFKRPWPIMAGILVATLLNHGMATWVGTWAAGYFSSETLKWALAALFLGFGIWILVPDKLDDQDQLGKSSKSNNAFLTTSVLFFLAEMGDKTQLATVALGAKFASPILVTIGTTMGMLVADGLAVFFGERLTSVVSMTLIRRLSAALFIAFAVGILFAKV